MPKLGNLKVLLLMSLVLLNSCKDAEKQEQVETSKMLQTALLISW